MKPALLSAINQAITEFGSFSILRKALAQESFTAGVYILAIGKSAYSMVKVCTDHLLSKHIDYSGYLLTKYGFAGEDIHNMIVREAGHPIPDQNSLTFSKEILCWLENLSEDDTLIILLSGSGSALFEVPIEGVGLQELIKRNTVLLRGGKKIAEVNQARTVISQVKGGKALSHVACKAIHCFALSDVEANDPAVIASGSFYSSQDPRVSYRIIGDNLSLRKQLAAILPSPVTVHSQFLSNSAEEVADFLTSFAVEQTKPGVHIFGGEAPVTVTGTGQGGRCTHLALDFAIRIAGNKHICLYAFASDGNDNLDGVSGAFVNGQTIAKLTDKGISATKELHNNNSFRALDAINATLPALEHPVNVNDIYLLIIN